MPETIDDELVHLTCPSCGKISSFRYASLQQSPVPKCHYCGSSLPVSGQRAHDDALRQAEELDSGPDALGSLE